MQTSFWKPKNHQVYEMRMEQAIVHGTEQLRRAVDEKRPLSQVFFELLDMFARERHQIANDLQDDNAAAFGRRRDEEYVDPDLPVGKIMAAELTTPLIEEYSNYNKPLLHRVYTALDKHIERDNYTFRTVSTQVQEETCIGRKSRLDISILTCEEFLKEWQPWRSYETYQRLCDLDNNIIPLPENTDIDMCFLSFAATKPSMEILKQKSPADYKKLSLIYHILSLRLQYPEEKKSDYVIATQRLEINKKLYALSHYTTWMYRTNNTDPIKRMLTHSHMVILHQDAFLTQDLLQDAAKLFQSIIEWKGENAQERTHLIALMMYELSHTAAFSRGSDSINKKIEAVVYRFLGEIVTHPDPIASNLNALTRPLSEFIDLYPSLIRLEPIPNALNVLRR